ncbi:conserved hypothetical protein [Solidesulfovibrio fructosivorans JJ]]|uniref:Uncharacterized protein n=1 Tax=Solidesulfovibrio fructosivorans JJ] TaxID=596151 RepID=E1JWX6_SOLFR|nr:hypothetical protein [Solidesulfovibrio fructosivorans]EFL51180.1 conserved hypothetical protein [Solidesulfovibrio fructosivorans JJ]]
MNAPVWAGTRQGILSCLALAAFWLAFAGDSLAASLWDRFSTPEVHGFLEVRAGCRTQPDPYEKEASVLETRLQAEVSTRTSWAQFKYKGDIWYDGVLEQARYDTREAWMFLRPADFLDIKLGRQVLTWGTGDLVFLNDLFPKDWQSFFIGRDAEYLKAPCGSVKVSLFFDFLNADFVFTPLFASDRFITGQYVSYWNGALGRLAGNESELDFDKPDQWVTDAEYAARLYRTVGAYELALYGYLGFWKNPGGIAASGEYIFPRLRVYGVSARGPMAGGIGNIELAYYDSIEDQDGRDPNINNSEMRYLVGFAREICRDFNGSVQYYVEQLLRYQDYRATFEGDHPRDELRHVLTLQLTKLLMNQNLELSLAGYWSPSDHDAYLRPKILYKWTDHIRQEVGANIFLGQRDDTMFGQYKADTNIYMALRYSF